MMGLSAGFMVLHFVLNRLRTPDARIPPLSVIITGTFACLFVGLILSKP
jgi:allophanate hydrolase subunit 1